MAIQYGDILLNNEYSIYATGSGDLAHGDNKEHQIGAIINANEGNFRKHPTLAASLSRQQDGVSDSREIVNLIVNAAKLDGWRINKMDIQATEDGLKVDILDAEKITDNTESLA